MMFCFKNFLQKKIGLISYLVYVVKCTLSFPNIQGNQDGGEGFVGTVVEIGKIGSATSPDKVYTFTKSQYFVYTLFYQNNIIIYSLSYCIHKFT